VSRKIERLINLTIALLATKRYLTKSEIFRSVDGYEGSDETKERMFERDKDDLRNLGVVIEVGSFDPVFEDEAGYRIKPEKYSLDLGEISGVQIALLSLAAEAWRGAALDEPAHSALTKLRSFGVESDLDALPAIAPRFNSAHKDFQVITHAISKRARISFSYVSETLELQQRTIEPYAVATRDSFWYLAGKDVEKSEQRTFRLDRIDGDISIVKTAMGYGIPDGFDLFANFESRELSGIATVDVRKGKAQLLRTNALTITDMGEWDRITTTYISSERFIELVLWHGEDAIIIEPLELQSEIIAKLNEIVAHHV
jgi:proteasome accessory factor B